MGHYERIEVMRDFPPRGPSDPREPVFAAGAIITARRVEFPVRGWVTSRDQHGFALSVEYLLEEGVDAVALESDDDTRADVDLAHRIGMEF